MSAEQLLHSMHIHGQALPRSASDTTRSALEGVGPELFRSGEHRNPAARHRIAQFTTPYSPNILHRGLGMNPFEDWSEDEVIGARIQLLAICHSLSVGKLPR
jgi:hypothetical protein